MSQRIKFNDNQNDNGVEGWYEPLPHADPQVLVVYAEGSNSFWDWVLNFLPFFKVRIDNKRAQRFYAKGAKWLANFIEKVCYKYGVKTVIIHGHSKGGAEAEIAAYILEEVNDIRARAITYGGARGLNTGLKETKRYICRGDIVPFLPPWPFYRHYKNKIKFGNWTWKFWKAHDTNSYKEVMKKEGI